MLLVALTALTAGMRATEYDLWICGTQVTSDNASDLTGINGVGSDGMLWYNASENTLYMINALIVSMSSSVAPIKVGSCLSGNFGVTIKVGGVCTLVNSSNTGMGMSLENCGTVAITGDSGILNVMGGTTSSGFDILFTGSMLRIEDGVTVNLLRGGIYNDGYWNETLEVSNANLYVHRRYASSPCIYMQDLGIYNAHLAMPYWANYEWNGRELTSGSLSWHGDIYIKAGSASDPYGYGRGTGYDMNGDGILTLADVTALVNRLLGKDVSMVEHEYVDLGLPSGTLWATCNIGASSPEEYGYYFAWGETVPNGQDDYTNMSNYASMGNYTKTEFSPSTYKWCKGDQNNLTKYCSNYIYGYNGFTDAKESLDAVDDAAYQIWGSGWRMPTKEQCEELVNYCTAEETTINGVSCCRLTAPHGGTLILPLAGYLEDGNYSIFMDDYGKYWTRTLYQNSDNETRRAWCYFYNAYSHSSIMSMQSRWCGLPIRPVRAQ